MCLERRRKLSRKKGSEEEKVNFTNIRDNKLEGTSLQLRKRKLVDQIRKKII